MAQMQSDARVEAWLQEGIAHHSHSRLEAARTLYQKVLQAQPQNSRAWHLLGVIALQTGQPPLALDLIGKALALDPLNAAAHNDFGKAQSQLGRYEAAVAAYDKAATLAPDNAEFHTNRGNTLYELKRYEAAIASYDAAVALNPNFAGGYYNRAMALYDLTRFEAAVASFDKAIALNPDHARAYNHRGNALYDLRRFEAALASYAKAISLQPEYADAHNSRGNALFELEQYAAALASFDRAIALQPGYADAHNNRGNALFELGQVDAALASYETAVALQPQYVGVHFNRGQMFDELHRHAEAVASYDRTLALKPDFRYAFGLRLLARMQVCDWRGNGADLAELAARLERGEPAANPFAVLALSGSAPLQKTVAQAWVRDNAPPNDSLPAISRRAGGGKIRIGYFSADFRDHPVSWLTAELYELHGRSRFEVVGFSLGPDTQDTMRQRLQKAFDQFIDVRKMSAIEIAALARQMQIDIAVDLTGLTKRCRPKIFALRAAPIQVSYIGYLGTMGAAYMDYLIADTVLVPPGLRPNYTEKLAYLPSYQANDSKRQAADKVFARHELGLPPDGFVFCCFNANYKITPSTFDGWMRILARAPGAVLFLYAESETAAANLRIEALNRGVDSARLIFSARLPLPEYLARYRTADLFLDTLPYNAGTTASDALWMGLPVLTCMGETFAGRMAASLLQAIHLPELITTSVAEYEELAVALATDPQRMAQLKDKLARHRLTTPLFDAQLHTRSLEAAYTQMHSRYLAGLPPDDIHLASLPVARATPPCQHDLIIQPSR
jgi:predicted O-linked N-acetylglucosamine transferase (SPINDLY family)